MSQRPSTTEVGPHQLSEGTTSRASTTHTTQRYKKHKCDDSDGVHARVLRAPCDASVVEGDAVGVAGACSNINPPQRSGDDATHGQDHPLNDRSIVVVCTFDLKVEQRG